MKIADANIILRYLLSDNAKQFTIASELIENSDLFFPIEVIAEVVYVLKRIYGINREKISSIISDLFTLPNISTSDKEILINSLTIFKQTSFDFVDCILIAYNKKYKYEVVTFDQKIKTFIDKIEKIN